MFQEIKAETGDALGVEKSSRGTAFADYDNDGDLDILITNLDDRPNLLRNESDNKNHWLTLQMVGTQSNRDAIGAQITAQVGDRVLIAEVQSGAGFLSHNDSRVHFGLGDNTKVRRLEVRWPSGLVEVLENVEADQFLLIREGESGGEGRALSEIQ